MPQSKGESFQKTKKSLYESRSAHSFLCSSVNDALVRNKTCILQFKLKGQQVYRLINTACGCKEKNRNTPFAPSPGRAGQRQLQRLQGRWRRCVAGQGLAQWRRGDMVSMPLGMLGSVQHQLDHLSKTTNIRKASLTQSEVSTTEKSPFIQIKWTCELFYTQTTLTGPSLFLQLRIRQYWYCFL